jgi:hypothetical protein
MTDANTPTDSDQADMTGTSMEDLPAADGTDTDVDVDVDAEAADQHADELEDAQQDAAERREKEGGYQ